MNYPRTPRSVQDWTNQSRTQEEKKKVAVIGGGFYGCVTALKLAKSGFQVTIFEQHSELFQGTSGTYSIRLHAGPHYPRSTATRDACRAVFQQFQDEFPTLIAKLQHSLYALGIEDAEGLPARVTESVFDSICQESEQCSRVDPHRYGVDGVVGLWKVYEPCLYQDRVRGLFTSMLEEHPNVKLAFNHRVRNLFEEDDGVSLDSQQFDWAINCTYFTSFANVNIEGAEVRYQPCLTLTYEDTHSNAGELPFMFTVMDGWFPCLMPIISGVKSDCRNKYMLYHAKYTILGSYSSNEDCQAHVKSVTSKWVNKEARPRMEQHMETFLPGFTKRFRYTGFLINTATKVKTNTEFRRALVWRKGRIIHEFSGKFHESISAAEEAVDIILKANVAGQRQCFSNDFLKELCRASPDMDGACDMGVHRW